MVERDYREFIARAQERMREDYQNGRPYNPIDLLIIFGDPNQRFVISPDPKFMREQFFELNEKRKDLLKRLLGEN